MRREAEALDEVNEIEPSRIIRGMLDADLRQHPVNSGPPDISDVGKVR